MQLRHALLEFGVEPREVELVELFEFGPVACVHGIKPVNEFVGDFFAQSLVEEPRQPGRNRHDDPAWVEPPPYNLRSAET